MAVCKKCNSLDVQFQTVSEQKSRGCLTILFYILLICIPVVGWFILVFLLLKGRSSKTATYGTCQVCGNKWRVS